MPSQRSKVSPNLDVHAVEEELPPEKIGDQRPGKIDAALRTFVEHHKPRPKHLVCLKVRIKDQREPSGTRIVEVANLPPDRLSEWVLRELSGCHPEYHFWTPDGEPVAVSRITHIQQGKTGEHPFEPVCTQTHAGPFRPLNVRMCVGRGALVQIGMANIPDSDAGRQLVQRLMSTDMARERTLYATCDFLTTDYGWMPINKIDPTTLASG